MLTKGRLDKVLEDNKGRKTKQTLYNQLFIIENIELDINLKKKQELRTSFRLEYTKISLNIVQFQFTLVLVYFSLFQFSFQSLIELNLKVEEVYTIVISSYQI